jgi:formate hydrogenlyase transcriptional activator
MSVDLLRDGNEQFSIVADAAPVMIWMSGGDMLCTFFNRPWLEFTGRSFEQELGNGWAEGVHAEDLQGCLETYMSSFNRRQPFSMEYRLRRADGEYRWILDNGVPKYDREGQFSGYIGSAIDITSHKRADLELRAALAENERLRQRLEAENIYLQAEVENTHNASEIVGRSQALRAVLHKAAQVAATDAPVLLLGETGTGKELIAHALHVGSARRARPLIAVNCAALPPSLIESELFGHEKGAFTGATHARPGRFELANGSTLFLDEIGDLDLPLQAKLLRALHEGEIQRLGSSRTHKFDVRIIAATNRDLEAAMHTGLFRADLYYRLAVFPIALPPLRERQEDIPLLVWHIIQSRQRALGRSIKQIPQPAMDALVAYDWPGNVRELQNVIERALILSTGPQLQLDEAFSRKPTVCRAQAGFETLRDAQRAHILTILERCAWTIEGANQAAARLGLRPSTLRNRMRKLGIHRTATR